MTAIAPSAAARPRQTFSWLRVRTVVRRLSYVVGRSPDRWFLIFVFPFIDVILFGSIGAFIAQESGTTRAAAPYLLAGIMLNHFLFQTEVSVATGFMEETWSRNVLNMMTTPVREVEYLVALTLFAFAKLIGAMATVSLAALVFYSFGLGQLGWGVLPLGLTLTISGLAMGLWMIGLLLRYGQSAEIFTWATSFLVLALSGVFNPIRAIPGPLQPVSRLLPTTYAFEAMRALLDGKPTPWGDLARAGFGGLALLIVAAVFLARMLRTFRKRGYVTRYS
jgi:ABC-2 type transport system permease protein